MNFLVENKEVFILVLLLSVITVPLICIFVVTLQNLIKKPYHKYQNDGNELCVYFCQKYGYVAHYFVKKNGKWKRKRDIFIPLVLLGMYALILIPIVVCLHKSGFETDDIIGIGIVCLSMMVVSFSGVSITQNFLLKRYIKKNKL